MQKLEKERRDRLPATALLERDIVGERERERDMKMVKKKCSSVVLMVGAAAAAATAQCRRLHFQRFDSSPFLQSPFHLTPDDAPNP